MKQSDYAGIDYSLGRCNTAENGIRYGVISQNSIHPEALNDFYDRATDEAYEDTVAALQREFSTDPEQLEHELESLNMNWETEAGNLLYERDGYELTGCLNNDLFVLKSPYYTHAQFCSPCVPGAGNLDTPCATGPKTFALGPDWFENGVAPYPVYSVETGQLVETINETTNH